MISDPWIKDVQYYLDSAMSSAGPRKSAKHGKMAYYTDAGDYGEPPGVWYSYGRRLKDISWQVKDQSEVLPHELRRLANCCDVKTGKKLVKRLPKNRRVGIDICFSPPKDFSILFARANREGRRKLDAILYKCVRKILDQAMENGLIEVRQGKGSTIRSPAAAVAAALFMHSSTRSGNPQKHIHAVLINAGLRPDGFVAGGINNEKFKDNRKLLDALFKFDLARELELLGVNVEAHEEHGFTVAGITENLRDALSERRMEIKLEAARMGFQTKDNATAAQKIALRTRKAKSEIPQIAELDSIWEETLKKHGVDMSLAAFDQAAIHRDPSEQAGIMKEAVEFTVGKMTKTRSYFTMREVVEQTICTAIGHVDHIDNIGAALKSMTESGVLIQIGEQDGQAILSTQSILAQERRIIEITKARLDESSFFDPEAVKAAITDTGLSQEQQNFLEDIFGSGGTVAGMGGAGTGKTRASAKVKTVCEASGLNLLLCSPEWRAAGVLAKELESAGKYSLDRIVNQYESGKLALGPTDVILCDEGGKMHRELASKLMEIGLKTGCKICLIGDTKQMASVRAGDPLSLVYNAFPTRQIREIKRQKVSWQRKASMKAQAGAPGDALSDYAAHGKVSVLPTTDDAIDAVATAFRESAGTAIALTANNRDVALLNAALRREAKSLKLISVSNRFQP